MKQSQEIKLNWTERENLNTCFCLIFDHQLESFALGR